MTAAWQDIRFALRSYRRAPGFLAVALVTLALAVGANVAIFSVLNGLYLRPLPFEEPDRLVRVGIQRIGGEPSMNVHTAGHFSAWREAESLERVAAYGYRSVTAERGGVAEQIFTAHVVGSLFDVLGVEAAEGRVFTAADEGPGAERLAVLGAAFARRAFGEGSPVGEILRLDGAAHTVLGVMPPDYRYPDPGVDAWTTSEMEAADLLAHDDFFLRTVARLAPGRTVEQAREELARVFEDLRRSAPTVNEPIEPSIMPLRDVMTGGAGRLWGILMATVVLVLVVASVNLANLLMARAVARRREMALRASLGASLGRLVRQALTESLVLAGIGGILGVAVGYGLLRMLLAWMPGGVPTPAPVALDATVLAFALVLTGLAGILFGIAPALLSSGRSLRARAGRVPGTSSTAVTVQVALAGVLLAAGGLTARSFFELAGRDPGIDVADRYALHVALDAERPAEERLAYHRALEERVAALPEVRSVALSSTLPVAGFTPGAWVNEPGDPRPQGDRPTVKYQAVSPGYFETMGIPLVRGRLPTRDDGVGGTPSLVLSERAARELFPDGDALGRRFDLGLDASVAPLATVVGVVGDVRHRGVDEDGVAAAYGVQELMPWWRGYELLVHARSPGPGFAAALREEVRRVDPSVPLPEVRSVADALAGSLTSTRNTMLLFALLAAVGLAMSAVGVFGVVAYVVSRRTREIGVRIAVGGDPRSVRRALVLRGLGPVAVGVALGLLGTWAGGGVMQGILVGVPAHDPLTLAGTAAALLAIGWVAVELPVRRGVAMDPSAVLSSDA